MCVRVLKQGSVKWRFAAENACLCRSFDVNSPQVNQSKLLEYFQAIRFLSSNLSCWFFLPALLSSSLLFVALRCSSFFCSLVLPFSSLFLSRSQHSKIILWRRNELLKMGILILRLAGPYLARPSNYPLIIWRQINCYRNHLFPHLLVHFFFFFFLLQWTNQVGLVFPWTRDREKERRATERHLEIRPLQSAPDSIPIPTELEQLIYLEATTTTTAQKNWSNLELSDCQKRRRRRSRRRRGRKRRRRRSGRRMPYGSWDIQTVASVISWWT